MEVRALAGKTIIFSIIGLFFWLLTPNAGLITYATLLIAAFLWLLYEVAQKEKRAMIKPAAKLGFFLMVLDFAVENLGFYLGLWTNPRSIFPVLAVPVEIMALTMIGGTAWALHLPSKPDKLFISFEILIFGFFGALGEYLLMLNGMMVYQKSWTSLHAFIGYTLTWILLLWVWYKVIKRA